VAPGTYKLQLAIEGTIASHVYTFDNSNRNSGELRSLALTGSQFLPRAGEVASFPRVSYLPITPSCRTLAI